jgi:hypothetical protein
MVKTWHNGRCIVREMEVARREWHDSGVGLSFIWNEPQNVTDHISINVRVTYIDCGATSPFRSSCVIICGPMHTPSLSNDSAACIGIVIRSWDHLCFDVDYSILKH